MGDDETDPTWIPRFNTLQGNDLAGSVVGCLDDFDLEQGLDGMNVWASNNCDGTINSPPVYLWRLCPNSVSHATATSWQLGVAQPNLVQEQIDEFNSNRPDGGAFATGSHIPAGTLVATNFDPSGSGVTTWEKYPVSTVVRSRSWGIFQVLDSFLAPTPGACLLVFP